MKKGLAEVEKRIFRFLNAIGMGIVAESTKAELMRLEKDAQGVRINTGLFRQWKKYPIHIRSSLWSRSMSFIVLAIDGSDILSEEPSERDLR